MATGKSKTIHEIDDIAEMFQAMMALDISCKGLKTLDQMKAKVKEDLHQSEREASWTAGQAFSILSEAKDEDSRKRHILTDLYNDTETCLEKMDEKILKLLQQKESNVEEKMKNHKLQLARKEYFLLVAGETSSGKSSLINLILGDELLPHSVLSTTSTICELKFGDERKIVAHFKDKDPETGLATKVIPLHKTDPGAASDEQSYLQQISPFVHVKNDRERGSIYKKIELFWPHSLLQRGIVIIDSPGVGESDLMDEIVIQYLPQAFAFIYTINSANAGGVQKDRSRAVSETNLLIHLNRILDAYDAELKNEALIAENTTLKNTKIIHRLDRKDRHQDVQDACQIHDLSLRESFLQSCEQIGIPPLAMTYFLDRITSGDSELIMRNLGIGPTGAVAVAEALARNASVKRLDISLNDIQDKGAIAVAKLLEVNGNIVNVSLSENKIGKDGAEALGNMLTVNDSLLRIDISRNQLTDEDIQFFSSVLQTEDSLTSLDVSHNSLGITGGEYLGEMVALNSSLRELNLGWNRLGDQGVKTFCVGLNENRTLEKLDLCWNEIGHEGAKCIASSIEHNGKLMVLNLNNNRITDRGMEKIAKSLEFNDTLKVLKIGFNLITSGGACALLRSLLKNSGSAIEEVRMAEVEINSSIKELYYRLKIRKPRFQLLELSTASGDLYHFVKPQNPMMVLDDYLKRNQLNARRHRGLEGDEDCY